LGLRYRLRRAVPARALVAALLAAGGLMIAAPAAPASASLTCKGLSCHGHDPNVYGCVVSSQKFAYYYSGSTFMATLTNKYSIKCNANWSQAQLSPYAKSLGWNYLVGISTTDSAGGFESMCWNNEPGSPNNTGNPVEGCPLGNGPPFPDNISVPAWTDMVDGTNVTISVMEIYDAYGNPVTPSFPSLQVSQ
jgi:hypothetical protein